MSLPWSQLVELKVDVSADTLAIPLDVPFHKLPLVGESPQSVEKFQLKHWYKIGPHQYAYIGSHEPRLLTDFAWAPSDGALAFALTGDSYFDDAVPLVPPVELLPNGTSYDYATVSRLARELGPEQSHDYVNHFSVRDVQYGRFTFLYRSKFPLQHEFPFHIRLVLCLRPADGK